MINMHRLREGDTLPDPYVVLFDGAITVGLHDRQQAAPQLTFVRPRLRDYGRPLRRLGIEVTDEHLRHNEFNSISFNDPGGQEIVLVEARTFSPGEWDTHNVAACGEFFAEFRADYTATAVGGIYRDADVHCAFKLPSTKAKFNPTKKLRQATLAIACLYLNLSHLLRGGASEGGSICPLGVFSNVCCNAAL